MGDLVGCLIIALQLVQHVEPVASQACDGSLTNHALKMPEERKKKIMLICAAKRADTCTCNAEDVAKLSRKNVAKLLRRSCTAMQRAAPQPGLQPPQASSSSS